MTSVGMTAQRRQLKLGAVTMGVGGPGQHYLWLDPEIPGDASVNVNWYIEQARLAEAAKFDLIFIVDSQFITPDSPPHYLNRLEPMTLLSALAVTTEHLGLVATMTTSYNDPFNVARRLASLDLISGGRSGWNVVTSGDAGAAANFSREEHFDYDTRYGRGFDKSLAELGRPFAWHDFRQYDLDAPFPQEALRYAERGFRTQAENIAQLARDRDFTLRQTVQFISSPKPTPFAGAPATVADQITGWFEGRALDGLNYHIANPAQWRRFREEVVPILQERGVVRREYDSTTLRGNLGLPVPENRYSITRQEPSLAGI